MQVKTFTENEILPFLEQTFKGLIEQMPNLKFDKNHPQHMYAICLYSTILGIAESCILLIRHKQMIAFPTVLRSLFEAHVDLLNAIEDSVYYKKMYLRFLEQKLKLLTNAKRNPNNPFFSLIVASMDINKEISELESESKKVKKNNLKLMNVWDRFEHAKLQNEYHYIYWELCLYTHNNLSALERRHIEQKNGDHEVFLFKDESLDNSIRYFDSLLGIMLNSSIKIHSYLETTAEKYFVELKENVTALRLRFPNAV